MKQSNHIKNETWVASLSLLSMSKCQAPGALKSSNSTTVSFDLKTGMARFSNFYINDTGMYVVLINVRTLSGSQRLTCHSEPIVAKQAFNTETIDTSSQPNLKVNYSGDYSQLSNKELKQMKAIFYNCVIAPYSLVTTDTVYIYKGSVMISIYYSSSTSATSQASLSAYFQSSSFLSLFPSLSLNSVTANGLTLVSYSYSSSSGSGSGNSGGSVVVVSNSTNNETVAVLSQTTETSNDSVRAFFYNKNIIFEV